MQIYKFHDVDKDRLAVFDASIPGLGSGINIRTDPRGCSLPDDEIPALISALQDYMSKRAKQITRAAGNGR